MYVCMYVCMEGIPKYVDRPTDLTLPYLTHFLCSGAIAAGSWLATLLLPTVGRQQHSTLALNKCASPRGPGYYILHPKKNHVPTNHAPSLPFHGPALP